jgi:hypothetical protein
VAAAMWALTMAAMMLPTAAPEARPSRTTPEPSVRSTASGRARIHLDRSSHRQQINVDNHVTVRTLEPVAVDTPVSCGIPGHDRPGTEVLCETLQVDEPPLRWEVSGRCSFATDFAYRLD